MVIIDLKAIIDLRPTWAISPSIGRKRSKRGL